jgi:hypothetical protein
MNVHSGRRAGTIRNTEVVMMIVAGLRCAVCLSPIKSHPDVGHPARGYFRR